MGWPEVVDQHPEHVLVALVLVLVVVLAGFVAFGPRPPRVVQGPPPYRPPKARRDRKRRVALVAAGWALLLATAACEYLPPIVVPTPPPTTQPPATPPPTPEPVPTPTPTPAPTAPPTPQPSPTPCVPHVVPGEPGCTPCSEQIEYLERRGYFRPIGGIWYESDNCGSAMVNAKCEVLNARPHLGFPACSVWRKTTDASPKRAPEGDTCVPRVIECPPPTPSPSPTEYFNCNGEYEVPANTCGRYPLDGIKNGVHSVVREQQAVPGCKADQKCPARVGDRVWMNGSPYSNDPRCPRGAIIPGNCVVLRLADVTEWSVDDGTPINREDGGNAHGWLAWWKPKKPGRYYVTACVGSICGRSKEPVVVE